MSETKIIRNDRGLDFRRIEQFIKMFQDRCSKKSRATNSHILVAKKQRESEAYAYFKIAVDIEAIKSIDEQIKKLKEQRRTCEEKVRDFTQGLDESNRYNTYDTIKEGSPIQLYINEGCEQIQSRGDSVWKLNEQLANEIWFAKDLEQAIEIMQQFQNKLDDIRLDGD